MAISAQKFLPATKGTAKSLPQAKISSITLTSQDKKNVNTIRVKTIQVDKILKGTLAADKKRLTDKKKEASKKRKDDVEAQLEKKPTKDGAGFKMPKVLPKMGFLGWIKNFIGNILLGFFAVRLVEHLPKLKWVLKGVMAVGEFIINFGGRMLNGLTTFIDLGYKAYDWTRGAIKNLGGDGLLKQFDRFTGVIGTLIDVLVVASIVNASRNDGGGGGWGKGKKNPRSWKNRGGSGRSRVTTSGGRTVPRPGRFPKLPKIPGLRGVGNLMAPVFAFFDFFGRKGAGQSNVQAGAGAGASWAGFSLASGAAATKLSPLLITPIPGARVVYGLGVLGAGILGSMAGGAVADTVTGANKVEGMNKGGKVKKPSRRFTSRVALTKKKRDIKKPVITPIIIPQESREEGGIFAKIPDWITKEIPDWIKDPLGLMGDIVMNPLKIFGDRFSGVKFFGPILTLAVKSLIGQKLTNKDYNAVGVGLSSLINFGLNKGTLLGNIMSAFAKGGIVDPQILKKEENVPKWISAEVKKSMESIKDDKGFWPSVQEKIAQIWGKKEKDPKPKGSSSPPDSATGASMLTPGSVPGGKLNLNQLVHLAKAAGASDSEAIRLAAIAMYESGGDSKAHNPKYPDNSYGLWQINMLDEPGYMLGEERRNRYKLSNNEQLWDPARNASIALDILRTSGWSAWSTNKLVTQKDLDAAKTALNAPPPQSYPTSTKAGPGLFPLDSSQNKSGSKLAGELGRFLDMKGLGGWGSGVHRHPEHPPWDPESGHRAGSLHYASQGARAIDIGGWGPNLYKKRGMSGTDDQTKIIEGIRAFERSKGGLKRVEFAHEGNDPSGLHDNHVHVAYHKGGEVPGRGERFAKLMGGEMVIDVDSAGPAKDLLLAINQASDRRGVMKAISDYAPYEAIQSRMIAVEKMVPIPVPMPVGSNGGGGMVVVGGGGEDPFSSLAAIG